MIQWINHDTKPSFILEKDEQIYFCFSILGRGRRKFTHQDQATMLRMSELGILVRIALEGDPSNLITVKDYLSLNFAPPKPHGIYTKGTLANKKSNLKQRVLDLIPLQGTPEYDEQRLRLMDEAHGLNFSWDQFEALLHRPVTKAEQTEPALQDIENSLRQIKQTTNTTASPKTVSDIAKDLGL